jgi:ferredoxin
MARKKKKPPFWSRVRIQSSLFATVLMNLNIPGLGLALRKVCTPGFNCHGCVWATAACPIGVVAYGTAMRTLPVLALSSIVAIGIVFGRLVCAFVCPFGFFQDLMHRIPSPKLKLPRFLNYSRYVMLVGLVFLFPFLLGFRTDGFVEVKTEPEEVATALVGVVVANNGDEPVEGVELTVAYHVEDRDEPVWRKSEKVRFDVTVAPGQEEWLDEFEIPYMPLHTVDGEDLETELVITVPEPLEVVETDPMEQAKRLTKATVRVTNLGTEPVDGVMLEVHCLHPETQEPVGEPLPFEQPRMKLAPGDAAEVVLFIPLTKCPSVAAAAEAAKEAGDPEVAAEALTAALMVTSPQSDILQVAPLQLYYCKVCPTGTLTALVPSLVEQGAMPGFWTPQMLRLGILAAVLVMMVLFARPFCRMFCPLGAVYSLFNRMAFVTMKLDHALCNDCGLCSKSCPLDLDVQKDLGGADCIQCGDCITACTRGGITRTIAFGAPQVPEPKAPAAT